MRRLLLVLCLAAVPGAATLARSQERQDYTRAATLDLLDDYAEGKYERAAAFLRDLADWVAGSCYYDNDASRQRVYERVARQFSRHAGGWILAVADGERPARRQVAAVVALEIAHIAVPPGQPGDACLVWSDARIALEWACATLRTSPTPTRFERLWQHAALSLIERARDTVFMSGGEPASQHERDHAAHVIERFPDEPEFRLAVLLARPELQTIGVTSGVPLASIVPRRFGARPVRRADLDATLAALDAIAATYPDLAQRATMRAGVLRFLLGDLDRSLENLERAAFGADAFARTIAGMIAARIHVERKRPALVIEALRDAVAATPAARTAQLALAARLFVGGALEEAERLTAAALTSNDGADPWHRYSAVDYLHWPRYLDALRASLPR